MQTIIAKKVKPIPFHASSLNGLINNSISMAGFFGVMANIIVSLKMGTKSIKSFRSIFQTHGLRLIIYSPLTILSGNGKMILIYTCILFKFRFLFKNEISSMNRSYFLKAYVSHLFHPWPLPKFQFYQKAPIKGPHPKIHLFF